MRSWFPFFNFQQFLIQNSFISSINILWNDGNAGSSRLFQNKQINWEYRPAENMYVVFARCQRPAAGSAFGAKTRLLKTSTTLPVSGSCFGSCKLFERIHSNAMNYWCFCSSRRFIITEWTAHRLAQEKLCRAVQWNKTTTPFGRLCDAGNYKCTSRTMRKPNWL